MLRPVTHFSRQPALTLSPIAKRNEIFDDPGTIINIIATYVLIFAFGEGGNKCMFACMFAELL